MNRPPVLRRIDHLLCKVPDIERALAAFSAVGFPVAWPIGRFWPSAHTCAVAIGGMNLEFIEPDGDKPDRAEIFALAFEPTSLSEAAERFADLGIPCEIFDKVEPDPELLRLRGFDDLSARTSQRICTNLNPVDTLNPDFFLCEYSPFLKERLSPENPMLRTPYGEVVQVTLQSPDPAKALWTLDDFGYEGPVEIATVAGDEVRITEIRLSRGPLAFEGFDASFAFV
jgi:hypothetical protein